jgi:hypothetical protein
LIEWLAAMAESPLDFTPYEVSFSGRVQDELAALIARAKSRGRHQLIIAAAKALAKRLRVYPQFGEPFRASATGSAQEWIGTAPPLVVRYVIYEDRRLVWVVHPMQVLRGSLG